MTIIITATFFIFFYFWVFRALRNHMITYDSKLMSTENQYILKSLSSELLECLLTMIQKMNNPISCLNALGIFVKVRAYVYIYIQGCNNFFFFFFSAPRAMRVYVHARLTANTY